MIVNDFEGKKTLDIEEGVFLRMVQEYPRDRLMRFQVVDGESWVAFDTTTRKNTHDDGTCEISYGLDNGVQLAGVPRRKNYAELIKQLLSKYQFYYGPSPGIKDPAAVVVSIGDKALASLQTWEAANGN